MKDTDDEKLLVVAALPLYLAIPFQIVPVISEC